MLTCLLLPIAAISSVTWANTHNVAYHLYNLHEALTQLSHEVNPVESKATTILSHLQEKPFYTSQERVSRDVRQAMEARFEKKFSSSHDMQDALQQLDVLDNELRPRLSQVKKYAYKTERGWHQLRLSNQKGISPGKVETDNVFEKLGDFIQQGNGKGIEDALAKAQNRYKIHIMPRPQDVPEVVARILSAYEDLPAQERLIYGIKLRGDVRFSSKTLPTTPSQAITFAYPLIVVYPVHTKEASESILEWLTRLLSDTPGLGVYPRFNTRVTSLLYYIQGNGDERFDKTAISAFDPATYYTFINTDAILRRSPGLKRVLNSSQKLIDPNTNQPF